MAMRASELKKLQCSALHSIQWTLQKGWRPFVLIAVAFWWGGVFILNLVNLIFPEVLPDSALTPHLRPDSEGTLVNSISAGTLIVAALFALINAAVNRSKSVVTAGWGVVGVTCIYLAWEELSDFHVAGVVPIRRAIFNDDIYFTSGVYLWVLIASPLILSFLLSMAVFVRWGLSVPVIRTLFVMSLTAWIMALILEASYPFLFLNKADDLPILIEESLEFGGSLLIVLAASNVFQQSGTCPAVSRFFRPRLLFALSVIVVCVFGSVAVAFVYRVPVVDARASTHIDSFHIELQDGESLAQELYMPRVPVGRFMMRVVNDDPKDRVAILQLRVKDIEHSESILREGQAEVPPSRSPQWISIDVPSLSAPEGRLLAMQAVAELPPGGTLRIVGTKTNKHVRGQLLVNGLSTWPDQDIEYQVYGSSEPTLRKLEGLAHTFLSDWRWAALSAVLILSLAFTVFVPAMLVMQSVARSPS